MTDILNELAKNFEILGYSVEVNVSSKRFFDDIEDQIDLVIRRNGKTTLLIIDKKQLYKKIKKKWKRVVFLSSFIAKKFGKHLPKEIEKMIEEEKYTEITKKNINKILNTPLMIADFIKNNPNSYIRLIAKSLGLHPYTVQRYIERGKEMLDFTRFDSPNLPNLPVLVKLKEGVTPEQFVDFVQKHPSHIEKKSIDKKKKEKEKPPKNKITDPNDQIVAIAKFLYENPNTHLREIAKELGLSTSVVYKRLKEIENFIVIDQISGQFERDGIGLPNLPIMIRLKEGVTPEGIARYMKFRKILSRRF